MQHCCCLSLSEDRRGVNPRPQPENLPVKLNICMIFDDFDGVTERVRRVRADTGAQNRTHDALLADSV